MLPPDPICIKNQYDNNNILGLDISELRFGGVQMRVDISKLRFGGVQKLVFEMQFKSHQHCDNSAMTLVILFSLKTMESLQNGGATIFKRLY